MDISAIERVSAELEIRNLIAKMFLLTDTDRELDEYAKCWAGDAIWERQGKDAEEVIGAHLYSKAVGRDQIVADRRAARRKGHGPDSSLWHIVTNIVVSITGADTARAWSTLLFVDEAAGRVSSVTYYQDDLKRIDGRWQVAYRRWASGGKPPQNLVVRA